MDRRTRRAHACALLCAAVSGALLPAVAAAQVTTDLNDFNLTETVSTWPSQFHISTSGDGWAAFRWLDAPNKATVISANSCVDLSLFGSDTFAVNDTNYHNLFHNASGTCFVVRGRTTSGSGSMVNHDGRVRR